VPIRNVKHTRRADRSGGDAQLVVGMRLVDQVVENLDDPVLRCVDRIRYRKQAHANLLAVAREILHLSQ
jgi:hypothetical protein